MNLTLAEIVLRHELAHAYVAHALGAVLGGVKVVVVDNDPNNVTAWTTRKNDYSAPGADTARLNILVAMAGPIYSESIESAYGMGEASDYAQVGQQVQLLRRQGVTVKKQPMLDMCRRLLFPDGARIIEAVAARWLTLSCETCDIAIRGETLHREFRQQEEAGGICE